jgi:predicted DNA-binding transcriptional regulator YafY
MRRADRLFEIIQRLRRRRVVTASSLAQHFDVSERTIYRDIADLIASDVPSGSCLLFDISSFNVSAQIRLHTKKVEAIDAHRQKLTMARPYCE